MNLTDLFAIGAITHLSILAHHLAKHTMTCPHCNQPDQQPPKQKILVGHPNPQDDGRL